MATKTKGDVKSDRLTRLGKSPALIIKVSAANIEESVAKHSGHCMIAEALMEQYPKAKYVAVDIQTIRFTDYEKKERYTYLTPRVAQIGIIKYDQGIKPEPFEFRLRSAQVTESGYSMERKKRNRERAQILNINEKRREKRAFLRQERKTSSDIPIKIGGRTPPISAHRHPPVAGQVRRAFGVRALEL